MADEYTDDAPSLNEAVDGTEDVTNDVDDTDAADDSRSSTPDGDEKERLAKEVADLRKRVSGQTQTWQQIKAEKEALQRELAAEKQRKEFWKQHGVDPDEVDRLVREKAGVQTQMVPQQPNQQIPPEQIAKVIGEHARQSVLIEQWKDLRDEFCEKNAEYNSPEWRAWFDVAATQKVQQERTETGQVLTRPREMLKYVSEQAAKMRAMTVKQAKKEERETREKVNSQGVTESKSVKRRPGPDANEEAEFTNTDYISQFRSPRQKSRSRAS